MASGYDRHDAHGIGRPHLRHELPAVTLEIVRGRARNLVRPIEVRAFLIGTAADCDLVLGDPQFAEVHAYLLRDPHGVTLRWLGHGPEVTVAGQPAVRSVMLADQDRIRTGPYEFRVRIRWPSASEQADVGEAAAGAQPGLEAGPVAASQTEGACSSSTVPRPSARSLKLFRGPDGEPATTEPTREPSTSGLVWLGLDPSDAPRV